MTHNRADGADGFVYWIGADEGAIKIGWALDPAKRVGELQTGNDRRLRVIAAMRGTKRDERALHEKLKHARGIGEWFDRAAALQLAGELGLEPHHQNTLTAVGEWRGAVIWTMQQAYNAAEAEGFMTYGFGSGVDFAGPDTSALSDQGFQTFKRCIDGLAKGLERLAWSLCNRDAYEQSCRIAVDAEVRRCRNERRQERAAA